MWRRTLTDFRREQLGLHAVHPGLHIAERGRRERQVVAMLKLDLKNEGGVGVLRRLFDVLLLLALKGKVEEGGRPALFFLHIFIIIIIIIIIYLLVKVNARWRARGGCGRARAARGRRGGPRSKSSGGRTPCRRGRPRARQR